jgi:hypothetical protein
LISGTPVNIPRGTKGDENLFSIDVPTGCTRLVVKAEVVTPVTLPLGYGISLYADQQLELLSEIAGNPDALQTSGAGKYSNVNVSSADVILGDGGHIGTRATTFIKEYVPVE